MKTVGNTSSHMHSRMVLVIYVKNVYSILYLYADENEAAEMARLEQKIMKNLGWTGSGLISMAVDGRGGSC